ncbi:transposase [Streptomyces mirabilis]|uniref:transposase n=1 Tax=Streptomyces mirabilis TaxID=68239 RepID=UPI00368CED27
MGRKPGRPPVWTRRQLIDGMRWRTGSGAPWRDVHERYGRPTTSRVRQSSSSR